MEIALRRTTPLSQVNTINQSFLWMFIGLAVIAFSSLFVATNHTLFTAIYSRNLIFFGLIIAELALVSFLSVRINTMSYGTALISFLIYAVLNGTTLSSIFIIYAGASIVSTFFVTAGVFGLMALYGYTTKRDLTTIGNLAFMALIGIIIASLVNIFLKNDMFGFILSCVSVFIFVGLTAYDTQKIKQISSIAESQNLGIIGALTLYLDFINIFLNLLRIIGRRRND